MSRSLDGSFLRRRFSRRDALRGTLAGAAGVAATALACARGSKEPAPTATAGRTPSPPSAASPTAETAAGWRMLTPSGGPPSARRDHSLVWNPSVGGPAVAYLFGGRSSGTALNDLWALDPTAPSWEQLQPAGEAPVPRFGHHAAFDGTRGRMLVFGGQAGGEFFNDLWAYWPGENRWQQLDAGSGPAQRYGAGAALAPTTGNLWVTHGFTNQGRFDDTWVFDAQAGAWQDMSAAGDRPVKRCLLRAVYDQRRTLLIFGGQTDGQPFLGDFWSFDINSRSWTQLEAPGGPSPRNLYAAVLDEARAQFIIFGGQTESGETNDLWVFDDGSRAWLQEQYTDPPAPRSAHDAVLVGEGLARRLVLFGGAGRDGELNDVWELTRTPA